MWITFTLITFLCWGIADLFYKLGNKEEYSHIKTGVFVGFCMGIHAFIYMYYNHIFIDISDVIKYLPISFFYISSMIIGYKGLRYLELSLSSPIQNTSGVLTALLLLLVFKEELPFYAYVAFILIFLGLVIISIDEIKENREERILFYKESKKGKIIILTIIFPLIYCVLDGLGTFLDAVYLDKLELISEDAALIAYEFTFFIYGFISLLYLKNKKVKIDLFKEKYKIFGGLFEMAGQVCYVYAISSASEVSAAIIGSYCILSLFLSRIILKEKLSIKEYMGIGIVVCGIIVLSFV